MRIVENYIQTNYAKYDGIRHIDMIVLHSTGSNVLSGTIAWFNNRKSQVSAHYVINRNGDIYKCVRINNIAWHARGYNRNSIGIELVQDPTTPLTQFQYTAVVELIDTLIRFIPSIKYLQAHYELSSNKYDPYDKNLVPSLRKRFLLENILDAGQ